MSAPAAEYITPAQYFAFPHYQKHTRCFICGVTHDQREEEQYQHHAKIHKYPEAKCTSCSKPVQTPWFAFYRLIYYDPLDDTTAISGVCSASQPDKKLQVPIDPESLVEFGRRSTLSRQILELADRLLICQVVGPYEDMSEETIFPTGFPIHAVCWKFLKDSKLGRYCENYLPLVLRAIRQRARDTGVGGWTHYCFSTSRIQALSTHDPRCSKLVRKIINQSRKQREHTAESEIQSRTQPRDCLFSRLPLEIRYKIMDQLMGEDVLKLEKALDWRLGPMYWKLKIPKGVYFEIQELTNEAMDWRGLYLRLEPLNDQDEFFMRRLIMESLLSLQGYFFRELEANGLK